jgi:DNA topoisomerase-3
MKLILAEKPDQAAKLASPYPSQKKKEYIVISPCDTFPKGAICTWAVGHLCELLPPEGYESSWKKWSLEALPLIPSMFKHRVTYSKKKRFNVIKSFIQQQDVSEIVIASDAGREGEAIIRLILKLSHNVKPVKRLWISSLTAKSVKAGFNALLDESATRPLYDEAVSRAYADWLIGMNASRVYTLLLQKHGAGDVFSIGRVQTPTLALIVEREKEIEKFISEPFWEIKASFSMNEQTYDGIWHKDGDSRVTNLTLAQKIAAFCENKRAQVSHVETKEKSIPPPYFFNLSSLQTTANRRYKYSPKKTLDIAQKLYVKGYISYPRTDSAFVTKEEEREFPTILQKISALSKFKPFFPLERETKMLSKRYVNQSKVTDHHAIIPTDQVIDPSSLSTEEARVYTMIIEHLIAAYDGDCLMSYTNIETLVDDRATFKTTGKQMRHAGWRRIIPSRADEKLKTEKTKLPNVRQGDQGDVLNVTMREGKTEPPKRYTEGELITVMKSAGKYIDDEELVKVLQHTEGLGTEATRAGIITLLKQRSYIEIIKNIVYPTEKGKILIEALGNSLLASPEMTAKWEQRLAEIGRGIAEVDPFILQAKKLTTSLISDAKKRSATWTFNKEILKEIQRSPKNKTGKVSRTRKRLLGKCPVCQGNVIDKGKFYGCANYKTTQCSFTVSKRILGRSLTSTHIKALLSEGCTPIIDGFQQKNGKTFNAALKWEANENKMSFSFGEQQT